MINDFGHWIPAFAGMTVEGGNDGICQNTLETGPESPDLEVELRQ